MLAYQSNHCPRQREPQQERKRRERQHRQAQSSCKWSSHVVVLLFLLLSYLKSVQADEKDDFLDSYELLLPPTPNTTYEDNTDEVATSATDSPTTAPTARNATSPTSQNTTSAQNTTSPTAPNATSPTAANVTSPAAENVTSPTAQNITSPMAQNITSPAAQNVTSPTVAPAQSPSAANATEEGPKPTVHDAFKFCELFDAESLEELLRGHDALVEQVTGVSPSTLQERTLVATDYNPHFQGTKPIQVQTRTTPVREGKLRQVKAHFPEGFNETRQVENGAVLSYINQFGFTATPIRGLADSRSDADSPSMTYHAITLGPEGAFTSYLVVWVDNLKTLERLRQDLEEEGRRRRQLQPQKQQRQRRLAIEDEVECPEGQVKDSSCINEAWTTYDDKIDVETFGEHDALLQPEMIKEAHELDVWRFAEIARAGAVCAASEMSNTGNEWDPVQVWGCLSSFLPSIQQRYMLRYTPILRKLRVEEVARSTQQYVWGEERDEEIETCCVDAPVEAPNRTVARVFFDEEEEKKKKNGSNRQRRRALLSKKYKAAGSNTVASLGTTRATRTAREEDDKAGARRTTADTSTNHRLRGTSPRDTEEGQPFASMSHDVENQEHFRFLGANDDCDILDFDEDLHERLMSIVDDIFGVLFNIGAQQADAPEGALLVKGFDPHVKHSQVIENPIKKYDLTVTPVKAILDDDLELILKSSQKLGTKPARVRRLMKKFEVEATAVSASSPELKNDFEGLLLAGEREIKRPSGKIKKRKLQFLWPVNYELNQKGQEDESGQTRRRRRLRNLEEVTSFPDCPNVDESCVDRANANFQESSNSMLGSQAQFFEDSNLEETALRHKHMEAFMGATVECLFQEKNWGKTMIKCVRLEKAEAVNRQYVADSTRLFNEEKVAMEEMESVQQGMDLKRTEEYSTCCMRFGSVSYATDPLTEGFFGRGREEEEETTEPEP